MKQQTLDLIIARARGFFYELGALIATGFLAFLLDFLGSDVFNELVTKHFGETAFASLVFLVTSGIIKHIRNVQVLGSYNKFGGPVQNKYPKPELI